MPFPFRLLRRAVQARAETTGVAVRMQQPRVGSAAGFGSDHSRRTGFVLPPADAGVLFKAISLIGVTSRGY